MSNRIITISREFGSGGRTVGKLVAEKLGIPCYDHEIIQKIAQESGYCEDFVADRSEHASRGNWLMNAFGGKDYYGNSIQDKLRGRNTMSKQVYPVNQLRVFINTINDIQSKR